MGAGASNLVTEWLDNQSGADLDQETNYDTVAKLDVNRGVKADNEAIADDKEAEPGEQKEQDEDTMSLDSKDSDDTCVLEWRMPIYLLEKRQAMQNEIMPENKNNGAVQTNEQGVSAVKVLDITAGDSNNVTELDHTGKDVNIVDKNLAIARCKSANDGTLAKRMPKYLLEKRQRMHSANRLGKGGSEGSKEKDISNVQSLNKVTSNTRYENDKDHTVDHASAGENVTDDDPGRCNKESANHVGSSNTNGTANNVVKEVTITESTSSAVYDRDNSNPCVRNGNENGGMDARNSERLTDTSKNTEKPNGLNDQKQNSFDQFEQFKSKYGVYFRRRKSVANKQTLILTKVGTKFQLMTVPAYLPNQRLYRSTSFVKNYIPPIPVVRRKRKSLLI